MNQKERKKKEEEAEFVSTRPVGFAAGQGGAIPFKTLRENAKSPKSELGAFLTKRPQREICKVSGECPYSRRKI